MNHIVQGDEGNCLMKVTTLCSQVSRNICNQLMWNLRRWSHVQSLLPPPSLPSFPLCLKHILSSFYMLITRC